MPTLAENEVIHSILAGIEDVRLGNIPPEALYFEFGALHEEDSASFITGYENIGFPTTKERH